MCDFFWLSPADQGDLSDVVRQQLPAVQTPATAACSHESLGAHDLPEEDELLLLLQGANCPGDDHDEVRLQQQQLVHGDGMGVMVSSSCCDPLLLQSEGLIRRHVMSGPPPQLGAAGGVEGECDVAALEMDEQGLDMAVDAHSHAPAIKRRKSQMKKVVCIPAPTAAPPGVGGRPSTSGEVVPSDLWAWRKYGQKPIKGSPYPRGYYRCSSSKGCSARKQVERSRTDPSMLVITYTSDHNHPWPTQRNALAGSTRPAASPSATAKSHHHQHHPSAAAVVPPRHPTSNIVAGGSGTRISIGNDAHHQQQLPKQEVLDVMDHPRPEQQQAAVAEHDLDMFVDMDGGVLNILSASSFGSQKELQHATAADDDDHLERDDKQGQQLLDPFNFSFFDWVGASFGIGEANKDGYT